MADGASVWCNAVVRSETAFVEIGEAANVQDFVMIHTDPGKPVRIGAYCSITHHATLHGCTIEDHCLIGINATIYNGAFIGAGSIVGQHAYVKDGTIVPPNSIVVGSPAKVIATRDNRLPNRINAEFYRLNGAAYKRGEHRAWDGPEFETWFGDMMKRLQAEYS
ncbi:gamma carbonic anhydrase family protein [Sandarakinorhabdus sp.]|uniref:gamma carbonic anhydrase family protein n=1 Tax=Sandarakinorhabdus sp. TaxID=1916663 RepID=UPI00286E5C79|nr:gamma carbonic anhydrase family protein [Sandarakinorhabdus sp.]